FRLRKSLTSFTSLSPSSSSPVGPTVSLPSRPVSEYESSTSCTPSTIVAPFANWTVTRSPIWKSTPKSIFGVSTRSTEMLAVSALSANVSSPASTRSSSSSVSRRSWNTILFVPQSFGLPSTSLSVRSSYWPCPATSTLVTSGRARSMDQSPRASLSSDSLMYRLRSSGTDCWNRMLPSLSMTVENVMPPVFAAVCTSSSNGLNRDLTLTCLPGLSAHVELTRNGVRNSSRAPWATYFRTIWKITSAAGPLSV